jgi:thiol-disulfide isomerase/thioredoxin
MDPVGIAAVVVVLVAGTAGGVWRSRTSGRLREVPAAAMVSGDSASGSREAAGAEGQRIDPAVLAGLGVDPGERATLLQFSSAFCAPCRAVRRVSAEVAAEVTGVRHVEVDAEEHLDAVRALGIWRTPTLLVLDRDGRVAKRATGVPAKPHLIAALTEMA